MAQWKSICVDQFENILTNFPQPWWIAGGHALDLWLGRKTREHGDLDFSLFREDFPILFSFLSGTYEFYIAANNTLTPLKTSSDLNKTNWNIWIKKKNEQDWAFQCLLADKKDGNWVYRRNHLVKKTAGEYGLITESNKRIIAPEVQLLFKSNLDEQKDQMDFDNVFSSLSTAQKDWLFSSIRIVHGEKHPWLLI